MDHDPHHKAKNNNWECLLLKYTNLIKNYVAILLRLVLTRLIIWKLTKYEIIPINKLPKKPKVSFFTLMMILWLVSIMMKRVKIVDVSYNVKSSGDGCTSDIKVKQ
jgi:hypothetical protein